MSVIEIQEDWEMEFLKDSIYLTETKMEEERSFWEQENRKPAKIVVLIDENIKKHERTT